ncbi:MAG: class I SAM-dependent methyltransferase [Pseudomonadota bacterium]
MTVSFGLYGTMPPARLLGDDTLLPAGLRPVQFSPLLPPQAQSLEAMPTATFESIVIHAPPATLERGFVLAHAIRCTRPGGTIAVWAANDRGGQRLQKEMTAFGLTAIGAVARDHARLVRGQRPDIVPAACDTAITAGALRLDPALNCWTQPGVFSWDRIDTGTALLLRHLPVLAGKGADFGCGIGLLSRQVLASADVTQFTLIDIDGRAIAAARRNVIDPRAQIIWGDMCAPETPIPQQLDFCVMNPPFHDTGRADIGLGQAFIIRARASLKPGGVCWLVANRHLPYEDHLTALFRTVTCHAQDQGFKIIRAMT